MLKYFILSFLIIIMQTSPLLAQNSQAPRDESHKAIKENPEEFLKLLSDETNKSLPIVITSNIQLLSTSSTDKTMIYNFAINADSDDSDMRKFLYNILDDALAEACANIELFFFWQNNINLRYEYFSKDKIHLTTLDINKEVCGHAKTQELKKKTTEEFSEPNEGEQESK